MAIITIIGAGMMGTALCWPLCDNLHTVRLVGTPLDDEIIDNLFESGVHPKLQRAIPQKVSPFYHTRLAEAIEGAQVVVSGVSSFGVHWFAETAGPQLEPEIPVLAVTKGLEDQPNGDLWTLPVVTDHLLPESLRGRLHLNAIGGPCISHELAARRHTGVVFCGEHLPTLQSLRQIFATDYYHIGLSTDVTGVEVCAALKNGYALGVGLAVGLMDNAGPDGLAQMYNPQAALFGQSCREMKRFLELTGGGIDNIAWLPGPGDLFVTVFGGRTLRMGRLLGQGLPYAAARQKLAGETLESVEIITSLARALPKLISRGLVKPGEFPLLEHLDAMINHGEPLNIPWKRFFQSL